MKHISDSEIKRFHSHTLALDEEMALLEHMAKCDFCAGRLASAFPEQEMLTPPPDLGSDILEAARKLPSRKQRQQEFFRYSAKVALAMGMALSLLVFCNFSGDIFQSSQITVFQTSETKKIEAYEKSLQEQEERKKAEQEKYLLEKQAQMEKQKKREEQSGKISASLKNFSSGILSFFTLKQAED